jgi:hypothetical protein
MRKLTNRAMKTFAAPLIVDLIDLFKNLGVSARNKVGQILCSPLVICNLLPLQISLCDTEYFD